MLQEKWLSSTHFILRHALAVLFVAPIASDDLQECLFARRGKTDHVSVRVLRVAVGSSKGCYALVDSYNSSEALLPRFL
ncbi:unnamed protein product [Protopolystoma xenopodis]|uniref:Secreted protein n=1 Tax=Protopolystoma xenopodis TaxID=117903 RepID=A0A3S5CP87_9PLAT|nr:unnamed protein product [Protopolystoma xenopodis]